MEDDDLFAVFDGTPSKPSKDTGIVTADTKDNKQSPTASTPTSKNPHLPPSSEKLADPNTENTTKSLPVLSPSPANEQTQTATPVQASNNTTDLLNTTALSSKLKKDKVKAQVQELVKNAKKSKERDNTEDTEHVNVKRQRVEDKAQDNNKDTTTKNSKTETAEDQGVEGEDGPGKAKPKMHRPRPTSFQLRVESSGTFCTHDVSLPAGTTREDYERDSLVKTEHLANKPPAKQYKFTLDAFQQESVNALEKGESVLVAAHTSAGKTAIAEYAIAMSLREKQRVIYTSPIKALSNQKFRELQAEFHDVGLMTGDVTINPKASCLVMTTEILRSMLYRGSELVHEIAWVIFDEVHYMKDRERGVVWEETIILVPDNVRFVFLSATIPNAREFSEWICQLKKQPCHTVYTDTRPVPLQHYLFPANGNGIHLVVDETGTFHDKSFEKAIQELSSTDSQKMRDTDKGKGAKNAKNSKATDCAKLIRMIIEKNYDPLIVFAFSRRDTENYAARLAKLQLNTPEESMLVEEVFNNAMDALSEEDQKLPQLSLSLPLLQRGIGIHHSGLLPILKELVEILFQEGLIKVLFATETFAMGLNMPAKTVVFTEVRKYDGESNRLLTGAEYIQMSGRAGRRGLDDRGLTILMLDDKLEPNEAKSMLKGVADPLKSTFHLSYNMMLNLLRAEEADPEYVISRSFAQFQADAALPDNEQKMVEMVRKRATMSVNADFDQVQMYVRLMRTAEKLESDYRQIIFAPWTIRRYLEKGRLVRIYNRDDKMDYGWGCVLSFATRKILGQHDRERNTLEVCLLCVPGSDAEGRIPKAAGPAGGHWMIMECSFRWIDKVSKLKLNNVNGSYASFERKQQLGKLIAEVIGRQKSIPLMDPFDDMHIEDARLSQTVKRRAMVREQLNKDPIENSYSVHEKEELVKQYEEIAAIDNEIKAVERQVKLGKGLILTHELRQMKRVLQRLGFVNMDNIVDIKGRVAAELNTGDELVLTELMLNGYLNSMSSAVIVALLSCFVFDERLDDKTDPLINEQLSSAFRALQSVATHVARELLECKLISDLDEYLNKFNPGLMHVIYYWCLGKSFQEIAAMTTMFEGSIIRVMRRLEELLRQLSAASKGIGNSELHNAFEQASLTLKRGVAFQASLYL